MSKTFNNSGNTKADIAAAVGSALVISWLAVWKVMEFVDMPTPAFRIAGAGLIVSFLLYTVIAPVFRK